VGSLLLTKIDTIFTHIEEHKKLAIVDAVRKYKIPASSVTKIGRYLEQLGLARIDYKNIKGPTLIYLKSPELASMQIDEAEIINKLKFFKSQKDIKSANRLIYDLFQYLKKRDDPETRRIYTNIREYYASNFMHEVKQKDPIVKLDSYNIRLQTINIEVDIIKQELEPVPFYIVFLLRVSEITKLVIEKMKEEVINKISVDITYNTKKEEAMVKLEYKKRLLVLMKDVFPDIPEDKIHVFSDYIILTSLGLGDIEILLKDENLEEIVINNAFEPIWVYHKKHGWLETNIILDDEQKIIHYAILAGRNVDKTITTLRPLLDGHLKTGDRFNATLQPISTKGNTLTIRKFAETPWTITEFLKSKTIDYYTAALIWTAVQYELSVLIVGGTGSGKTSALNVFSIFIPPNQRVISIEDTREIRLPRTLHWVPMETRLANPEGEGEVAMLDLIVNSLRMRPDRIIVGEIRRKKEAEVLFEAMHTGHSVYATLHANTVHEAIIRLTSEPIGVPKSLLTAVDLMVVQNRNRRTGKRRTFQIAEIDDTGNGVVLYNYNFKNDHMEKVRDPIQLYKTINLFSGLSKAEIDKEINDKIKVLKYFVQNNYTDNEKIGLTISYYYINKDFLMKKIGDKNR
jgi:archaeal flagellar protein FlaI